ncbi:hypothetical protein LTR85_002086 [Meristemomyces frigidus]|nr:hypothetical protein LTR85_002086 [Meristemomyces frigidus]
MAEPFSIATGALQVSDAGIKLAKTLYEYLDAVHNANKHLKAIALEVRITSTTLESLGTLLKDHDAEKLCSNNVIHDAKAAFDGCKEAFTEVDDTFKIVVKYGADGKASVSSSGRWVWPFKKGKVEMLQANLERLKTTLLLMLSVLGFAREMARNSVDNETKLTAERLQIRDLIRAKEDAAERYDQLVTAFSRMDTKLPALGTTSTSSSTLVSDDMPLQTFALLQPKDFAPTILTASTCGVPPPPPPPEASDDVLLQHLSTCAAAVSHLSALLNSATDRWKLDREFDGDDMGRSLSTAVGNFRHLFRHHEITRPSPSWMGSTHFLATPERQQQRQQQQMHALQRAEQQQMQMQQQQMAMQHREMQQAHPVPQAQVQRQQRVFPKSYEGISLPSSGILGHVTSHSQMPERKSSSAQSGANSGVVPMSSRTLVSLTASPSLRERLQKLSKAAGQQQTFGMMSVQQGRQQDMNPQQLQRVQQQHMHRQQMPRPQKPTQHWPEDGEPAFPQETLQPVRPSKDLLPEMTEPSPNLPTVNLRPSAQGLADLGNTVLLQQLTGPHGPHGQMERLPTFHQSNAQLHEPEGAAEAETMGAASTVPDEGMSPGHTSSVSGHTSLDPTRAVPSRWIAPRPVPDQTYMLARSSKLGPPVKPLSVKPLSIKPLAALQRRYLPAQMRLPAEMPVSDPPSVIPSREKADRPADELRDAQAAVTAAPLPSSGIAGPRPAQFDMNVRELYDGEHTLLVQRDDLSDHVLFGNTSTEATQGAVVSLLHTDVADDAGETEDHEMEAESVNEPFASLQEKVVDRYGFVKSNDGTPVARVVEGKIGELRGRRADADGVVRDELGTLLGRVERLPESEREAKAKGPFAGLGDLRVVEDGRVVLNGWMAVAEIVGGDGKGLVGMSVNEAGDVVDGYGNVKGHAKQLAMEHESVQATIAGDDSVLGPIERGDHGVDFDDDARATAADARLDAAPSPKRRLEENGRESFEKQPHVAKRRQTLSVHDMERPVTRSTESLDAVDQLLMRWTTVGIQ